MKTAKINFVAFLSGMMFAGGLAFSGMVRPSKVIGFLDITGAWDPSLAFVMAGAILVYATAYYFFGKRTRPLLDAEYHLPPKSSVDRNTLIGAGIFGIGWGLAGFCPGPAIASLVTLSSASYIFFASMIAGMYLFKVTSEKGS